VKFKHTAPFLQIQPSFFQSHSFFPKCKLVLEPSIQSLNNYYNIATNCLDKMNELFKTCKPCGYFCLQNTKLFIQINYLYLNYKHVIIIKLFFPPFPSFSISNFYRFFLSFSPKMNFHSLPS